MFTLVKVIDHFNRYYNKKISHNKTWQLVYLQPFALTFLGRADDLIRHSGAYASSFIRPRQIVHEQLKILKRQSSSDRFATLRLINEKLAKDKQLELRWNREETLMPLLRKKEIWQQVLQSVANKPSMHVLYQQWRENPFFQYHSSEGLLFLLMVCTTYQQHFKKAYHELQQNQRSWFYRVPKPIAKKYEDYLSSHLAELQAWRSQTIDMLLFRLRISERQADVTCDDVSYSLLKPIQHLNRAFKLEVNLYDDYFVSETSTFYKMQQAINLWGDPGQKSQLLQLSWYKPYPHIAREIIFVKKRDCFLWSPLSLVSFFPKYGIKIFELFQFGRQRFLFLENQQALLAQWIICRKSIPASRKDSQPNRGKLAAFLLCDELFQQALTQLARQPRVPWWQGSEQSFQKKWFTWLNDNFKKNRVILYELLSEFFLGVQAQESTTDVLNDVKQLINKIKRVLPLENQNKSALLSAFQDKIKYMESWRHDQKQRFAVQCEEKALTETLKQELNNLLNNYEKEYQVKSQPISQARQENLRFLRQALAVTRVGKVLYSTIEQYYKTMSRSFFGKLSVNFDGSILRCTLRDLLDNPKYARFRQELAEESIPIAPNYPVNT